MDYAAAMSSVIEEPQAVPLTRGKDGVLRISGSRVTLDSIVHQFQSGATAEQIQEDFPSVTLADIYSAIAYFLRHPRVVKDYLNEQAQAAKKVRRELEASFDTRGLREQLRRRRARAAG